jgi:mono/diheme cytochrome c family protein
MKIVGIIISVLVVEAILLLIFIYSGLYNVSTMLPDPAVVKWIFSTTSDISVENYSKGILVPPLNDQAMVVAGFKDYHDKCEACHAAPGVEKTEINKGLYPEPPNLVDSAKEMPVNSLFWVIKNGIKSTGMPGFGKTNEDRKILNIVAFLEKMKNMTPQEYAAMLNRQLHMKK